MLTRYEVAVSAGAQAPLLVGYTIHKSRSGLRDVAVNLGSAIIERFNVTDADVASFARVDGRWTWLFTRPDGSQACAVRFTGRTHADARRAPLEPLA